MRNVTQILRAGNFAPPCRYASPVNGVWGKATMSTKCSSEPSPVILWVLSHHWESTSPRRAKPCKTARRVVAQASFSCPFWAIHLLAPYGVSKNRKGGGGKPPPYRIRSVKLEQIWPPHPSPSRPPVPIPSVASRHLPLIRGVGPRGEGFFGGPHPAPLGPPLPQGEGLGGRPHRAAPAAETDLLERNGGNNPSPLFPLFNFQLLC